MVRTKTVGDDDDDFDDDDEKKTTTSSKSSKSSSRSSSSTQKTLNKSSSSSSFPSPLARVAVDDARVSTDRGRAPVPRHAGHARAHATRRAKNVPLSLVPVVFIVVGVIALGLAADVLIPRAGAIKRDDAHANYVAGRDYTKKLRSKKDE